MTHTDVAVSSHKQWLQKKKKKQNKKHLIKLKERKWVLKAVSKQNLKEITYH